jgi:hypothetical protein
MRIAEQTSERLRLVDRSDNPITGRGLIAGLLFTAPVAIGVLASPTRAHLAVGVVFIAFIWVIIGIAFFGMERLADRSIVVFDGVSKGVKIGGAKPARIAFSEIVGVDIDPEQSVVLNLEDGRQLGLGTASHPTRHDDALVVGTIREFLSMHGWREPSPDTDGGDEEELSPREADVAAAERWLAGWNATLSRAKPCAFCSSPSANGTPLALDATQKTLGLRGTVYLGRCSHCARVHAVNAVAPLAVAVAAFFATFVFCAAVLGQKMNNGFGFGALFISLMLVVPIVTGVAAALLTRPRWFGTRAVSSWEDDQRLTKAAREGWTFALPRPRRR